VSLPQARDHTRALRQCLVAIGIWARDETPKGATFALAAPGAFGFYSDRGVIDLTGAVTPALIPVAVREGSDRVVGRLLFERVGRPDYLVDVDAEPGRWARAAAEPSPYRIILARRFARPMAGSAHELWCTVYAIDWSVVDATRVRVATRGAIAAGMEREYTRGKILPWILTGDFNHLAHKGLYTALSVSS